MTEREKIKNIIKEELSKSEVNAMIASKIDDVYSSRDFEKAVKKVSSEIIRTLFRTLWQHNSVWANTVKNS